MAKYCLQVMWLSFTAFSALTLFGCASFNPRTVDEVPFRERAQVQSDDNVRITAAVLSPEETKELFDLPLYRRGIQPIWLEIENMDEKPVWFPRISVDQNYFAPFEVAYMHHRTFSKQSNLQMDKYFDEQVIGGYIPSGSVRSGFVFTHLDLGTKNFDIDIVGEDHEVRTFTFFINVPGLRADHHEVKWDDLYTKDQIVSYDEIGLKKALESLPCCTTNRKGTKQRKPINLIVIGDTEEVFHALIRSGWNETGRMDKTSITNTKTSSTVWRQYRYKPISPLYVYGRPQDMAFRKSRKTAHEKNELRLWLSPMTLEGKPVWVGQINRDIGLRFARLTVIYKIDPAIDDVRNYILQDLWYSQGLAKFGFVKGVEAASIKKPRRDTLGNRYFTDGYRIVVWVSSEPVSFSEVVHMEWERPFSER
ncbi:MAG: LssY C-terminal domain-containing protein [Candidatus Scalindua sp.]